MKKILTNFIFISFFFFCVIFSVCTYALMYLLVILGLIVLTLPFYYNFVLFVYLYCRSSNDHFFFILFSSLSVGKCDSNFIKNVSFWKVQYIAVYSSCFCIGNRIEVFVNVRHVANKSTKNVAQHQSNVWFSPDFMQHVWCD